MEGFWAQVQFLFKRKSDGVVMLGYTWLKFTKEEFESGTDEYQLKRLSEKGYDVIRMVHRDENLIGVNFDGE